jgi:MFS family permease
LCGAHDAGFGDFNAIIQNASTRPQDAPVMVYMIWNQPPFAIVTKNGSGINSIKDFEGHTLGGAQGTPTTRLLPVFVQKNKLEGEKIKISNMAPNLQEPMLIKGDIDAALVFNITSYFNLVLNRQDPDKDYKWFSFGDYGMDLYSNGVMVSKKLLASNPKAVEGLVCAINKGLIAVAKEQNASMEAKYRDLAVGLNEFAGYLSVGLTAFLTGYIASRYGLRPQPFYLGIGYAAVGLALATLLVRDTRHHVRLEASRHAAATDTPGFWQIFRRTSFGDRNLFAASQAGLVNNLNDGMSWGIFPLFFASFGLGIERIGTLKAIYPVVWGVLQTVTGPLSDRWGRKGLIASGMWVQAAGLCLTAATQSYRWWLAASVLLGLGTAMVYPTLIASVSDASHPTWRARSLSVYRFWRDMGYAIGALSAGIITDLFGAAYAIAAIGALTFASGTVVAVVMDRPRQNSVGSGKVSRDF